MEIGMCHIPGEDTDVSSWCRFANHQNPGSSPTTVEDVDTRAPESRGEEAIDKNACNTEMYLVEKTPEGEILDRPQLWFKAIRDIDKGEEILYDYGVEYWEQTD